MRSAVKISMAWLVATAAAVALGVAAVGVVSDSVTETRPDRLSALGVREALARTGGGTGPESSPPEPSPPPQPAASTSTSRPATASTRPPSTRPPAEDRTYQLEGGTVGVRFENGGARLLWATPRPGYRVESSGGGNRVDVRFRSDTHESRLRAFWDNGPQAEIEERDA